MPPDQPLVFSLADAGGARARQEGQVGSPPLQPPKPGAATTTAASTLLRPQNQEAAAAAASALSLLPS